MSLFRGLDKFIMKHNSSIRPQPCKLKLTLIKDASAAIKPEENPCLSAQTFKINTILVLPLFCSSTTIKIYFVSF